jgi:hypothetical protein
MARLWLLRLADMSNETRQTLELAAQAESVLNLYMAAKRELNTVLGNAPVKVEEFPIVQSVRAQIATVRELLAPR